MRNTLFFVILLIFPFAAFSQGHVLKGRVIDQDQLTPVIGATIQISGTDRGTTTDGNGQYALSLSRGDTALVVSYTGMNTRHVRVTPVMTHLDIRLESVVKGLNEVVVVGYGTEQKKDVTGAIGSVKAKDFTKGAVRDAAQLITGKVAGLSVSSNSGDPTSTTQIMLRGIPTLMSSTAPLVLIDGIPGDLSTVAPEDIASVDVLKDGSAAAIYGTRATNGVILITTKQGRGSKVPTVQYDGYVSVQTIARRPDFLTAADYRRLIKEGVGYTDYGTSTDWLKAIMRSPVSNTHNLLFQGGDKITNYTVNLNDRNWQGLLKRSDDNQLRGNIDINHSMFNDKVQVHLNTVFTKREYWTGGDGYSFNTYVYRQALIRNPTDSIKSNDGSWVKRDGYNYDNPMALLMTAGGQNKEREMRLNGSVIYKPVEGLNLKLLVSDNNWNQLRGYATTEKDPTNIESGYGNSYASRGTSATEEKMLELTGDYTRSFGKNNLTLLLGYSYQDELDEGYWMQNWYFPTDIYAYNNMGAGDALSDGSAIMDSYKSASRLIGFFGRLNYNWNDKYLLMASLRREGSSKFGSNHRWGMFPAISAGWRISQENFLKNSQVFTNLKLRAGYGVTGTAPSDDYDALTSLNYGSRFLSNGQWVQGISPNRNPNPNLKWEQKEEYNIGLDFSLFNDVVSGSIDAYRRDTKDMLYNYPVPSPPNLYSSTLANVGRMRNEGIEVMVGFTPVKTAKVRWNSSVTFSTNQNRLVSISNSQFKLTTDYFNTGYTGEPIQEYTHRVQVGQPIGNFYGYKSVDIDSSGQWIVESKDGKPIPISSASEDDKHILGNGIPKYHLSWNNEIQYGNFDLSVNMHGAFGYQILNYQRMFYEDPKIVQYNMLKSAFDKVYGKTRLNNDLVYVSYYIENGNYWKIDNVTLGYNFDLAKSRYFRHARVYVSGLNLVTLTKYKGIDPEVGFTGGTSDGGDPLAPGDDDRDKYPTTRTFTLGVNLSF